MKFFHSLVALPTFYPGTREFWSDIFGSIQPRFPEWFHLTTKSKLPLFIHDLRHPWIEENLVWLEQRLDPTNDLCVAQSALQISDKEGRIIPANLFTRLEIDNSRVGIKRDGWSNMQNRLLEINKCPAALQQVTYLYIDVYTDTSDPGEKPSELLADVLSAMANLKKLRWGIPGKSNEFFSKVFARRDLQLSSITHLVLGALAQHIITICPNVERLEGGSYYHHWSWSMVPWSRDENSAKELLQTASGTLKLTSLSYDDRYRGWNVQTVRGKYTEAD
jgi:hypothetical protein